MRVLVAEDHPSLGPDLKKGLERCHYVVDLVANGEDALALGFEVPYDLIILDILLPGLDGLSVCRQLSEQNQTVPILFLTALGEVDQRVRGLDLVADYYLTTPFYFSVLSYTPPTMLRHLYSPNPTPLRLS